MRRLSSLRQRILLLILHADGRTELNLDDFQLTVGKDCVAAAGGHRQDIPWLHVAAHAVQNRMAGTGHAILDGVRRDVKPGDILTMPAGCRHTVFADSELKIIEVQLGPAISVEDKQKYPLPQA